MSADLCDILKRYRRVAVVGLSPKPERDSHNVAKFLKENGYTIIPVNPGQREILGEKCYPSLKEIPVPVDIVDLFRRSEAVPGIAEEAVQIGAKVFWMQLGIYSPEAVKRLTEAGVRVVMDKCIKVEVIRCTAAT